MAIRFNSADSFNNFFNTSLGRKNKNSGNLFESINLSDYNSLKTGTYKKLLKSYYEKNELEKTGTDNKVTDKLLENISSEDSVNKEILKNSEKINKNLESLEKVEYKESNRESIIKDITSMVSSYNKILDEVSKSKDTDMLTKSKWMTNYTNTFKSQLNNIGINIEEDNSLKINENSLKEAKIEDIKKLFTGSSSFGKNLITISGVDTYL